MLEITANFQDSSNQRDVGGATFTPSGGSAVTFEEVRSFEYTENSTQVPHAAEEHNWITSIIITDAYVSGSIVIRDYNQALATSGIATGSTGTLVCKNYAADTDTAFADTASETVTIAGCSITQVAGTLSHGAMAESTISFENATSGGTLAIVSTTASDDVLTLNDNAAAGGQTLSWVAPTADSGGSDVTITVSNAVLTQVQRSFAHGAVATMTDTFQAFSSDGTSSPMSVT